ncbi:hypothetical protein DL96DRAFT_481237 [Flagelloscypha sp. PMI_526]|nr:hypothetical protein DL96DRAFT_481237 [Flagelloscypha sp. PMI_526]
MELAFDDWSWATHHLSLNRLLGGEKSQIRVLDCTVRTSSDFALDVYRSAGSGFYRHLTSLTLKIIRFHVHDVVHQVNELHSLEVLVVTCKYLALRYSQYIPMYPPTIIPNSDSKPELSETSSSTTSSTFETTPSSYRTASPKYVIRHPLPYGHLEGDSYNTGCTACPEVRLWDVLKFYATSFPSIGVFGEDTRREEVFDYKQASLYCEKCKNIGYWLVDEIF